MRKYPFDVFQPRISLELPPDRSPSVASVSQSLITSGSQYLHDDERLLILEHRKRLITRTCRNITVAVCLDVAGMITDLRAKVDMTGVFSRVGLSNAQNLNPRPNRRESKAISSDKLKKRLPPSSNGIDDQGITELSF